MRQDEKKRRGNGYLCTHPVRIVTLRLAILRIFLKIKTIVTLTNWSHSTTSPCARFLQQLPFCSGRVLRGQVK